MRETCSNIQHRALPSLRETFGKVLSVGESRGNFRFNKRKIKKFFFARGSVLMDCWMCLMNSMFDL